MPKKKEHEVANYKFRITVRFTAVELFKILREFVKKQHKCPNFSDILIAIKIHDLTPGFLKYHNALSLSCSPYL